MASRQEKNMVSGLRYQRASGCAYAASGLMQRRDSVRGAWVLGAGFNTSKCIGGAIAP